MWVVLLPIERSPSVWYTGPPPALDDDPVRSITGGVHVAAWYFGASTDAVTDLVTKAFGG